MDSTNRSPSQVRMVDKERGTLTTEGQGTSNYLYLGQSGLEKSSTGLVPRDFFWDGKNLAFSSGSDVSGIVTLKDVKVSLDYPKGLLEIEVGSAQGNMTTLASSVQSSLDAQMAYWTTYLSGMDPVAASALIAEVQTWEHIAPEIKDGLIAFLAKLVAP